MPFTLCAGCRLSSLGLKVIACIALMKLCVVDPGRDPREPIWDAAIATGR